MKHCDALVAAILSVTYFAVVDPASVTFGSKTCVTWNGLMWMWNGWEMPRDEFEMVHSSIEFRSTATPVCPSNCLPLIVCLANFVGRPKPFVAKLMFFVPCTSLVWMSARSAGKFASFGAKTGITFGTFDIWSVMSANLLAPASWDGSTSFCTITDDWHCVAIPWQPV